MYGLYETTIFYFDGSPPDALVDRMTGHKPDLIELTVASLPEAVGRTLDLVVMVAVDENGRVEACENERSDMQPLVRVGCQLLAARTFTVRRGADGVPVRYTRWQDIRFVEDGASTAPG